MKLATWNINSLSVRLPQVLDWLAANPVDVLVLQEIKMTDEKFPVDAFLQAGYQAQWFGQKTYNGVALLSKSQATDVIKNIPGFDDDMARVITGTVDGVRVIGAYFPNGQEPGSDKFEYKMEWLGGLRRWLKEELVQHPRLVVMGDYNITFDDADVWDPVGLEGTIHCTEEERYHLRALVALGLHELARSADAGARVGVLSGPSFAIEVARGQPTALVAASLDAALCEEAVDALHSENLRIYTSDDPVGVEVGGAVKNVLAIATGIADGMPGREGGPAGLGLNARAALITRGLAEMTRLGVALGARPETFMGLSGLGDLVLTATGDLSRNRTVGRRLAEGLPLARILAELGHVAEGVRPRRWCCSAPLRWASRCRSSMPLWQCSRAARRPRKRSNN